MKPLNCAFRFIFPVAAATILAGCNSGGNSASATPPTSAWVWQGGSNNANTVGVYGTQGLGAASNIPGARYISTSWVDAQGNFWLFGGNGNDANLADGQGYLNDLWEYNPANKEWTWVSGSTNLNNSGVYGTQGIAAAANIPGARYGAVSWNDNSGNLWLFGGVYTTSGTNPVTNMFNDLWKYNIASGQWTWVSGANTPNSNGIYGSKDSASPGNVPGARLGAVSWTDKQGHLWLFGGTGFDSINVLPGDLNDLWEYNPTTNLWTWRSGEPTQNSYGIYGIQGNSDPFSQPGARFDAISWTDNSGSLWLFGGDGYDASNQNGDLNDLWRYNPLDNQWTWMSGSNQINTAGVYGLQGVSSPNSIPGARKHRTPLSWTDNNGYLWMFGGDGYGATTSGFLNDLWKYNPKSNQWTWISGSTESNAPGIYGTVGVSGPNNTPGARKDAIGWIDNSGNLWLFSGDGNTAESSGYLNDLWKYTTN